MKWYGAVSILIFSFATLPITAQDTATAPRVDFATFLSGHTTTHIVASALDRNGNLYVTGTTSATDFPTTAGAFRRTPGQTCSEGSCTFPATFAAKLSRDGSSLVYSTFLNELEPLDITVDADGNAYLAGGRVGPDYRGTNGAWNTKCLDPNTATSTQLCSWLVKLNAGGSSVVYSTALDGAPRCFTGFDQRIAVNDAGETYIAGTGLILSGPCPTTANAYRKTITGRQSGTFVMKVNAKGSGILFATWVSSASPRDQFRALALAPNGHVVIVGSTFQGSFPTTQGAFQHARTGSVDAFVAKLSSDGSRLLASTVLGGTISQEATSVAVDSMLNVYVAGTTWSPDFPTTPGAYRRTLDPQICDGVRGGIDQCSDIFVAKLPPDFSRLIFSTFLGGNGDDFNPSLAIDKVGHAYLTGLARFNHPIVKPLETDFRPTYVTKLNTSGSGLLFSTYFGGAQRMDASVDIEVDDAGDAYIAGDTRGTDLPTNTNAYQTFNHSDDESGFMAKLNIPPCTLGSEIPSVTICTPIGGVGTSSPVLIAAGVTDNRAVAAMAIYVDGVRKFTISDASHFDTRISMGVGIHQLTVKAWDADGRVSSSATTVTVQ